MPLATGTLPIGLRSPLFLHWRARDLSTRALSGQAGTLTRPNTQSVFDLAGAVVSIGREQPCFAAVDTDGDTVRDTVGLLLGNAAEAYSLQFEAIPQAMTVYTKFVPAVTGSGGVVLWRISSAASGLALCDVHTSAANTLVGLHQTGGGTAQTAGLTFAIGELVEVRLVLTSTGAVQLGVTRNG